MHSCLGSLVHNYGLSQRKDVLKTASRRFSPCFSRPFLAVRASLANPDRLIKIEAEMVKERELPHLSDADRALQETLRAKSLMGHTTTELQSTNMHRFWVALGASAVIGMAMKSVLAVSGGDSAALSFLSAFSAYILADAGTGIYHWGVDNYGDANTPIFGPQIDAFQGHHQRSCTCIPICFAHQNFNLPNSTLENLNMSGFHSGFTVQDIVTTRTKWQLALRTAKTSESTRLR